MIIYYDSDSFLSLATARKIINKCQAFAMMIMELVISDYASVIVHLQSTNVIELTIYWILLTQLIVQFRRIRA